MESTEQQRKAAWLVGCSVEEWQRRGQVALSTQKKTVGGFVMCEVNHHSGGVVRMNRSDSDTTTPSELGQYARKYLDDFIASGDSADLARSASLISAALARAARR
jgi:hypothetical protein